MEQLVHIRELSPMELFGIIRTGKETGIEVFQYDCQISDGVLVKATNILINKLNKYAKIAEERIN